LILFTIELPWKYFGVVPEVVAFVRPE